MPANTEPNKISLKEKLLNFGNRWNGEFFVANFSAFLLAMKQLEKIPQALDAVFAGFVFSELVGAITSAWDVIKLNNEKESNFRRATLLAEAWIKLIVCSLAFAAASVAVIGGTFLACAAIATVAPLIFTGIATMKFLFHTGAALYYSLTTAKYNGLTEKERNAKINGHLEGAIVSFAIAAAIASVLVLSVFFPPIGMGVAALAIGFGIAAGLYVGFSIARKLYTSHQEAKKSEKQKERASDDSNDADTSLLLRQEEAEKNDTFGKTLDDSSEDISDSDSEYSCLSQDSFNVEQADVSPTTEEDGEKLLRNSRHGDLLAKPTGSTDGKVEKGATNRMKPVSRTLQEPVGNNPNGFHSATSAAGSDATDTAAATKQRTSPSFGSSGDDSHE